MTKTRLKKNYKFQKPKHIKIILLPFLLFIVVLCTLFIMIVNPLRPFRRSVKPNYDIIPDFKAFIGVYNSANYITNRKGELTLALTQLLN